MPHFYEKAALLEGQEVVDGANCVRLVQSYSKVGLAALWRSGVRVLDSRGLRVGTVIATFDKFGRYANQNRGNHAAFFVGLGATDPKTGKPGSIIVIEQFKGLHRIQRRAIRARVKTKAEGGLYSDSDNATTFYVVE